METKRKISKDKYILAAILTALIFSLGLTLGFLMENYRGNWMEKVNKNQENEYESLQLQYYYINELEGQEDICPVLQTTLNGAIEDLSESLSEFLEYEKDSRLDPEEFDMAGRKYLLDNIRYWLFAKKSKELCNLEIVPILYFYEEDCPNCPSQGTLLTYFRNTFEGKVLVFPINMNFQDSESLLKILASEFKVNQYPTLIIDGKKYEGMIPKQQLHELICESLTEDELC
ncbi:hypothetical protein HOC13_01275 [Candidatus Woesearchaeota archaeon]|jgi:hypothetical protein|nr:hypothetical protein [Candidatus Woesearchaeota archaeon]